MAEANTVMASSESSKTTLYEKLEGTASTFVNIEAALDLPILPREAPTRRATHFVERATELKEMVEVGMQGFEEGWLHCTW